MPFVNSVSGLGMLSTLSDALGLIPYSSTEEKQNFFVLVAASQLYFVGGHTFHEFLTGVEIGQTILSEALEKKLVPESIINFENCMKQVPDLIYESAARSMLP